MSDQEQHPVEAALERLDAALREFAQLRADDEGEGQILVTASFVCWEQTTLTDDGNALGRIEYAIPAPSSGSAAAGVARLGSKELERDLSDVMGGGEDDE